MTTRLRVGVCLAVWTVAVSAPPAVGQDVALRYRWTKGEELRYRTTLQTSTAMSGTGIPDGSIDQTMSQIMRTIVDDVAADGSATLRQVIESFRVEMNNPMGKMVFDSTAASSNTGGDPLTATLSSIYSTMIGQSITVVTSPTGGVQKIEGMARLMDGMLKNLPPDPVGAGLLDNLKKTFSDDATQDMSARGFAQFPDRPLKPGDTWDDRFTRSTPMTGAITTSRTSTFQGVESRGGISMGRVTAKLAMTASGQTTLGPYTMQLGEGAGESELLFDVARGRMQRLTMGTSQPTTMSGIAPDGSNFSMRTLVKTTMTLELLER
jgi:hypothetical protein